MALLFRDRVLVDWFKYVSGWTGTRPNILIVIYLAILQVATVAEEGLYQKRATQRNKRRRFEQSRRNYTGIEMLE